MQRNRFSLIVAVVLLLMLAGCGNSQNANPLVVSTKQTSTEAPKAPTGQKTVALVMKTLTNPFFIEMEKGARKAEKEFGIQLIVKTGAQETSIDQQIAIIDEMIRAKVDAIVIAPASSTELIPVLKKAYDAKIPIVNIDNRLDPEVSKRIGLTDVPFVSVNNEQGAYMAGNYLSNLIKSPAEAVVIEGIRSAKNAQERTAGALKAFKENTNITVVAVETANWKIDEAYAVAARLYEKHPNIGVFFCGNDMMALGVMKYLKEKGKTEVLVAGYDALTEAKTAVKAGTLTVTVDQQADLQGYLGVKLALQKVRQERVALETTVDVKVIDKGAL